MRLPGVGIQDERFAQKISEGTDKISKELYGQKYDDLDFSRQKTINTQYKYELDKGTKTEKKEHALDTIAARKIAADHLAEDSLYYVKQTPFYKKAQTQIAKSKKYWK